MSALLLHSARKAFLALVLVSSVALAEGAAELLSPTVEGMLDGSELVLALRPGAPSASLHYVVRTGAAKDPLGKEGMAHLLEHLIFSGSYDVRGADFRRAVKAAGGDFNGFTTTQSTTYVLRAPSAAFLPLAEQLLRIVTSPTLDSRMMQREVEIIRTESTYFSKNPGFREHLEDSLFDGPSTRSILGNLKTLNSISRKDVVSFYTQHYVPANTSLVFTGGVGREEVLGLLERAVRLPPSLPGEYKPAEVVPPLLPIEQNTRAPMSLIAYGYAVDPKDRGPCLRVAALLEMRLRRELHVKEPITTGLEVQCMSLRGNTFLMVLAFSASLDASNLPDLLQESFELLARKPMTAAEEKLLEQHLQRLRQQQVDDDAWRGTELARQVAQPRSEVLTPVELLAPPAPLPRKAVQDFARRTFVPDRQVVVNFSPFAG
ncbi:M16 family metallopeptidase [Archangium lansingense]|uniref:Pitrilysin family protein n=1 Tax=Archangium lansingense TaxID=2995310 RepID=A0ABT4A4S9_9BACT|nr:pitrilysin family protein [Archangium lansinium]MCY1076653.1 pitrilysin family protein [Archangium lansinium]